MVFSRGTKIASSMHPQIVVLLIDNSGSMAEDGKCEQVTEAVQDMVITMQSLSQGSSGFRFLLNICAFGDAPRKLALAETPLEIDIDSLKFLGDDGATNMHLALGWAKDALEKSLDRCRTQIPRFQEENAPNPLCVLLSDGENTGPDVTAAANALREIAVKNGGVEVVAVGVAMEDQHFEVMKSIATGEDHALRIDPGGIADFISEVGSTIVDSKPVAPWGKPR